jgi:hypothetical protein
MLDPHEELGHVNRPDKGASPGVSGKRLGRIHVSGLMNMCAHSEIIAPFTSPWDPCGTTNGAIASFRLFIVSKIAVFRN